MLVRETKLAAALCYAAAGYRVFPCRPNSKEPAIRGGFRSASADPGTIRRWWGDRPYNIGIPTGQSSGIWVLDIDGDAGAVHLTFLEAKFGKLPRTMCAWTSSGCHMWWQADDPVPSSTALIGPGLDVRGDGGYILVPPSIHPDGTVYRWAGAKYPAKAPGWLTKKATKRPAALPAPVDRTPVKEPSAYAQAALNRECETLELQGPGGRNRALYVASFKLHQLVAAGRLDAAEVQRRLTLASALCGYLQEHGLKAVEKTIASGAKSGLQNPRSNIQR